MRRNPSRLCHLSPYQKRSAFAIKSNTSGTSGCSIIVFPVWSTILMSSCAMTKALSLSNVISGIASSKNSRVHVVDSLARRARNTRFTHLRYCVIRYFTQEEAYNSNIWIYLQSPNPAHPPSHRWSRDLSVACRSPFMRLHGGRVELMTN